MVQQGSAVRRGSAGGGLVQPGYFYVAITRLMDLGIEIIGRARSSVTLTS